MVHFKQLLSLSGGITSTFSCFVPTFFVLSNIFSYIGGKRPKDQKKKKKRERKDAERKEERRERGWKERKIKWIEKNLPLVL